MGSEFDTGTWRSKMKKLIPTRLWSAGVLIFLAAAVLSAQQTTLTLTGVNGESLGGVYTSPYIGTIGTNTNVDIICDDFAAETYFNETWTANVTNLSQLSSTSPVQWTTGGESGSIGAGLDSEAQAYTVAAYLATEILNSGNTATQQEELSYALWGLFDPTALSATYLGSDLSAAQTYLNNAVTAVQSGNLTTANYANVTVYTYVPNTNCSGGGPGCPPGPQEFLTVSMAEPSYPAILGFDLLAVVGLLVAFRRRISGIIN
jgi:hypothetical protein